MSTFKQFEEKRRAVNENNDCAIIALSVVTGVSYEEVRMLLTKLGRRWGKGTPFSITKEALDFLGYKAIDVNNYNFKHPLLQHKTIRTLGRVVALYTNKKFLIRTPKHILGVSDGQVVDWTRGRCNRIKHVIEVVPKASHIVGI